MGSITSITSPASPSAVSETEALLPDRRRVNEAGISFEASVIPTKAGIHSAKLLPRDVHAPVIPAKAGMTAASIAHVP